MSVINQKFYTSEKVVKGKYVDNPNHYLFAKGIYRTKLKEENLPDSFVKWTSWYSRYVDMADVYDIVYRANSLIGNNTMKYDNFFISYSGKIEIDEATDRPKDDSYDYIISAVWGKDIIEKIKKYSPDLIDSINTIEVAYNERLAEVEKVRQEESFCD